MTLDLLINPMHTSITVLLEYYDSTLYTTCLVHVWVWVWMCVGGWVGGNTTEHLLCVVE